MRHPLLRCVACLVAFAPAVVSFGATSFFVSPGGNDGGPGTADQPFRTVAKARDAVRAMKDRKGGIVVTLRGGNYFLIEPLVLTPEDSGTADAPVTYAAAPGENPVLSGGKLVTGWAKAQLEGKDVWAAKVQPGPQPLRCLWMNGKRAVRARFPNKGKALLQVASVPDATEWQKGENNFRYNADDLKAWPGVKDAVAEVLVMSRWVESRLPVTGIEEDAKTIRFGKNSVFTIENNDRYWIEGLAALLDEPGEWHYDRAASTLYYLPRPGEDMSKAEALIPNLSQVLRLEGKPGEGKTIDHVTFRGITFSHTDWGQGWPGADQAFGNRGGFSQAAVGVPAAVHCDGVRSCTFDRCTFAHVGNYAMELARGCQNNRITHCTVTDAGAGGVKLGETRVRENKADQTFGNEIFDCRITDLGNLFPSAVGVWIGQSYDNHVSHNEIAELYYTAVSVGWTWGYGTSGARGNVIEHNHIHHVGRRSDEPEPILSDMGGLYSLGIQPGTIVRNNRFHDIQAIKYGGWGIYFDEGTTDAVAENNVVYRTTHGGFHQHYGKNNIVRNNILAFGRDMQVQRTRPESHRSFTFERNIVVWKTGEAVVGGWDNNNYNVTFDHNLYWRTDGGTDFKLGNLPLDPWRKKGLDVHSEVADPKFVDVEKDDFNLKSDSPALKLGFVPFDQKDVGPRP